MSRDSLRPQVLAHDIVKSGTLRVLRLGDNALGPSAGDAVAACMQLPSLEVLDLSGVMLGKSSQDHQSIQAQSQPPVTTTSTSTFTTHAPPHNHNHNPFSLPLFTLLK
jgi:hypothetical protein